MTDDRRKAALLGAFAAMIPGVFMALGRAGEKSNGGLFGLPSHFWSGFGIGLSLVMICGAIVALRKASAEEG